MNSLGKDEEIKNKRQRRIISNVNLEEEYKDVVLELDKLETKLRIQHLPSLQDRAPAIEADEWKDQQQQEQIDRAATTTRKEEVWMKEEKDGLLISLRKRNLKNNVSVPSLLLSSFSSISCFSSICNLDVSYNELMDLPGLSQMPNITMLNLERNWFNTLPKEIGTLKQLKTLNASRNFLRPNAQSLVMDQLKQLLQMELLDLRYNQKCGRPHHRQYISQQLPQIQTNYNKNNNHHIDNNEYILMTLWEEIGKVEGSYVGKSAAERNPFLLRSQLEPWGTVQLRRRLVQDFGQIPTDANTVDRASVMSQLLQCYQQEGLALSDGTANRTRVYLDGTPVSSNIITQLLTQLRLWTKQTMPNGTNSSGVQNKNRERPSIHADNYMILQSPIIQTNHDDDEQQPKQPLSRRAIRKGKKWEKYKHIWKLAMEALQEVDPIFAQRCTEIAVTYGFRGSPHIDKQNCGPFYGLSLGNFVSSTINNTNNNNQVGGGGICVECSARVVAVMNTHNRLGRVDGRYPHWVDHYNDHKTVATTTTDETTSVERYSLIYYETGTTYIQPGPAIFSIPRNQA